MQYTLEMEINAPRKLVIDLFGNPENLAEWQKGLEGMEHLTGEPGTIGAKTRLHFRMGRRNIDMVETITVRDLPEKFAALYEAKGVRNEVINRFHNGGPETTTWELTSDFRCSGFLKLMTLLVPGMFRKQSLSNMNAFREFAEREYRKNAASE